jgi:hypothetical protein
MESFEIIDPQAENNSHDSILVPLVAVSITIAILTVAIIVLLKKRYGRKKDETRIREES